MKAWQISVPFEIEPRAQLVFTVQPQCSLMATFKRLQSDDPCWVKNKPRIRLVDVCRRIIDDWDLQIVKI